MPSILFVPYPETTHLNASYKLAKTLKGRGHKVSYLSVPDLEDYLRAQSLDVIPCFKDLFPTGFIYQQAVKNNIDNFEAISHRIMTATQGRIGIDPLNELDSILKYHQPDLIIIDKMLPDIAMVVNEAKIPLVIMNTHLFNFWEDIPRYRSLWSVPELVLCAREFDYPREQRKKHYYYIGANIDPERNEVSFPWERLDQNKPVIYCSLGNQSHLVSQSKILLQAVVDSFAMRNDRQLVISIGSHLNLEEFHSVSPNVIMVNKAPQLKLLKRVSIMISQGGFSSVKECILFGVPMIVFPMIRDHPAIAARVVYHGLGVRGNILDISVDQITSFIDRIVSDPAYKLRITKLSEKFHEIESQNNGSRIVENLLSRRSHKLSF